MMLSWNEMKIQIQHAFSHLGQVRQKRNTLNGLSETHLISEDTVDALMV